VCCLMQLLCLWHNVYRVVVQSTEATLDPCCRRSFMPSRPCRIFRVQPSGPWTHLVWPCAPHPNHSDHLQPLTPTPLNPTPRWPYPPVHQQTLPGGLLLWHRLSLHSTTPHSLFSTPTPFAPLTLTHSQECSTVSSSLKWSSHP
jgi:hypothetical protein